jgi:hypothetical protein
VSLPVFQSSLARLVTDLDFRAAVRAGGCAALPSGLGEVERERLVAVARDPGLEATRTIYKGFRLSKLLITLPLTRVLLGGARLEREVSAFWVARPPVSFYYLDEALAFCEHLRARMRGGLRVAYLDEVLAYETASVELERARLAGEGPTERRVEFRHDPAILLGTLAEGRRPRGVPASKHMLIGRLDRAGKTNWKLARRRRSEARGWA